MRAGLKYDVVVLSDIEQEVLVLYPWERMQDTPMGPNRLESIREFVRNGGGLIMIGGWESFQGSGGGYHGTLIEEILPVRISPEDALLMSAPKSGEMKALPCTKRQTPSSKTVSRKAMNFLGILVKGISIWGALL